MAFDHDWAGNRRRKALCVTLMSQLSQYHDVDHQLGSIVPALTHAALQLAKPGSISFHLSNFKRIGNPLSLVKAGAIVVRQGRLREVLYGVRCFLTDRRRAGRGQRGAGSRSSTWLTICWQSTTRSCLLISTWELRRRFPIHLLPADLVTFTHIFAHSDDWMVVGEYADARRGCTSSTATPACRSPITRV